MAEKDIAERTFISLNDVFADIFNVLVFGGEQVVEEGALTDAMLMSQYKADTSALHEQERDTHKLWNRSGINLVLVGIENQTVPDKDMPFRVIGYDGASYRSQLLKSEEKVVEGVVKHVNTKERYPVVTIVLYFGENAWKYSTHLKDCFYPELPEDPVMLLLNEYIQDYKVHVFDIPRLPEETVKLFQSDFRVVAEYFSNLYTNPKYEPEERIITHVDEFLKLMKVLTGDNQYERLAKSLTEQEKEGMTMCRVLDYHEALGEAKGEERMSKLVQKLLEEKLFDIISLVTSDKKAREKYYKEYGI